MPTLDDARRELTAKIDAFVFGVGEWQQAVGPRDKHATETIAWSRLEDSLNALLGCFDPLFKSGALTRKGQPGVPVEVAAFRADERHVDIVRDNNGINFTNQMRGGLLTARDVINRVEQVDELFRTVAHRLEKLVHDGRVNDSPDLRIVATDLARHAETLRPACQALAGLARPV
jgi:hypothetical protein